MDELSTKNPSAFLVTKTMDSESFVFSVTATSRTVDGGGKRTFVSLLQNGNWRCRSCGFSGQCHHCGYARAYAINAGIIENDGTFVDVELQLLRVGLAATSTPVPSVVRHPVSYRPVPVPRWCKISSDTLEYNTIPDPDVPPSVIELDASARCCCGDALPDGKIVVDVQPFTVFGIRRAIEVSIEVSKCICCKHWRRNYGSDCGIIGVFNWNNAYGFTHELLNQYTNVFTSAENPLSSFVTTVRRSYEASYSRAPFCSTETFTKVWFAFTSLQPLDSGMDCGICGKYPEIVIADGVSIGYSSSKFKPGLRPPSSVDDLSPINHTATLIGAQGSAIVATALRKELRALVDPINLPILNTCSIPGLLSATLPGLAQLLPFYQLPGFPLIRSSLRALFNLVCTYTYKA